MAPNISSCASHIGTILDLTCVLVVQIEPNKHEAEQEGAFLDAACSGLLHDSIDVRWQCIARLHPDATLGQLAATGEPSFSALDGVAYEHAMPASLLVRHNAFPKRAMTPVFLPPDVWRNKR